MKKKPEPPAQPTAPEKSPLEKMRDLTRRVINVPKSEIPDRKQTKHERHPNRPSQ